MDIIRKKEQDRFLLTINFADNFAALEMIDSSFVVCVESQTAIDVSDSVLFFEDTNYQQTDIAYGDGRYGGIYDNLFSSITFGIQNGLNNKNYKITAKVITNFGNKYEKDIILELRNLYEGNIDKQTFEKFAMALNHYNSIVNEDVRYNDSIQSQITTIIRKKDNVDVTNYIMFSSEIDGVSVNIGIQDGDIDEIYQISNTITTMQDYKYTMDVLMRVEEI
mgnify:FL=1